MTKDEWQDNFPQEAGVWWFYGWRFERINRTTKKPNKPELHLVEVSKISNGFMYVTDGNFMYEQETGGGKWIKAKLPKLPKLEVKHD